MLKNFGGLPKEFSGYDKAKVAVLPIPFDQSVSWQRGASKGPSAIIEASAQVELYDIETDSEVYKQGIFTAKPIKAENSKQLLKQAYDITSSFLKDQKFVITLGGDHSISIGPITAHRDYFGEFSVLHLDAHADMRDSYDGNKYSHASIMARVKELGVNIVAVGIRSMEITEKSAWKKGNLFLAADLYNRQEEDWINEVVKKLGKKVYISFDVDVFDSSLMSSTGTPEPGGLNWYQVTHLLRAVCNKKHSVIGADVVELAPISSNKAPDFLIAKMIYKFLSYLYYK
jgi:agmatinase